MILANRIAGSRADFMESREIDGIYEILAGIYECLHIELP